MKNNILKSIFISLILVIGVSNAWGGSHTSGHVYFDNTKTNWTTISMFIGQSNYSRGDYGFGKISNTQIWHYEFTNDTKFDNWQEWMLWNGSWGGENNSIDHRKKYFGDKSYSGLNTNHEIKGGFHFISAPSNTNNGWALSVDYHENRDFMNTDQKAVAQLSSDNGSSGIANSIVGTVKVSGYQLTDNNKTSSKSQISTIGTSSEASVSLVRTSTVTLTATPASGYEFLGWYDGNSKKSANSTLTYACSTSTKTYYARFKEVSYYIKHPFDGNNWTWEEMTKQDDGTFTLDAKWYGSGVNINTTKNDQGSTWIEANKIPGAPNNQTGITVTYIYNPTDKSLKIEAKNIYLVGEFNDWNTSDEWELEEDPANPGIYTLTKRFEARDRHQTTTQGQPEYEFKLNIKGTNYTVEGNGSNKHLQYTRQSTSKIINDGTAYSGPYYNLLLQADITGDYVFTYDAATQTLTVQHPEYQPEASYLVGDFSDGETGTDNLPKDGGAGKDWTEAYGIPITVNGNTGTVEICDWPAGTWEFKVKINGIWYGLKETMNTSGRWILTDEYAYLSTKNCTIQTNGENGCYTFKYTTLPNGDIELMIIFPNDTRAVTFKMNGHGDNFVQNVQYNQTATAPHVADMDNHLFCGWYTDAACTPGKEYDFDTPVTEDITLYAKWIPYGDCIFFKNNLNWDEVYVYFYSSDKYWDNNKGTGSMKEKEIDGSKAHYREFRGQMTQIGKTDIWYFDYISSAKKIDPTNWGEIKESKNIAFTAQEQYNHEFFDNTKVIRRGDFKPDMQLFIPQTDQTPDYLNQHDGISTRYYNKGLWMKYNSIESGYDWRGAQNEDSNDAGWNSGTDFTAERAGGYTFTAVITFNSANQHYFKIHSLNNTWFGNGGKMTQTNHTKWIFREDEKSNAKIVPTTYGPEAKYIFTLYLGDGEVEVSLDYPLSEGDYRLAYKDNTHPFHPGHYIKKRTDIVEKCDTVSFFVHHDLSPKIHLQQCTDITGGTPTWTTINEGNNSLGDAVTSTSVYNFILKQSNNGSNHSCSVEKNETHLYTGDYYIRTDATAGGWASFRQASNKMTYSSYAESHSNFNHYFVEWIHAGSNVKFTIANDYSYCISDTLDGDNYIEKDGVSVGCLPANANVRFGWDSRNNTLTRAYISGSSNVYDRFLVVTGNDELKDANENTLSAGTNGSPRYGLNEHEDIFKDMGNWIYQVDVTANNQTLINLTAKYNDKVQIFKGQNGDPNYPLLTSTSNENYKIRLIYNFKSNHLMMAWLAEDTPGDLGADMMVIRENQEQATQIDFTGEQLTNVKKAYAVMRFTNDFVNGSDPIHARKHYWISFPFDVKISEVFGFSEYMDHWILQWYDGQKRADEGWWYESKTFWKYITNKNYTLEKGVGYVLTLDLSKMGASSNVFENTDVVNLYFPSTGDIQTISGQENTTTTANPHTCNIERENRNIYDSHWNMIGVPGFADISNYPTTATQDKPIINLDTEKGGGPSFYYEYLPATNSYRATNETANFQTMYGYMVQYFGDLSWTTTIGVQAPDPIAARRNSESELPEKISLSLEIAQGEEKADQTFVQLQQEGATTEFDMNLDLTKIINSGANIYTLTGDRIQAAGNALPMEDAIVPVGVQIAAEGEYIFRMPDGTEGMVVELIDYETNTRTNLLLSDYIVTLPKGTSENRFALHIQPQKDVVTGVGNIDGGVNSGEAVNKYLTDGKLIIRTAEGVVFDAQGHRL